MKTTRQAGRSSRTAAGNRRLSNEERTASTRRLIIQAAIKLLAEQGFVGLTNSALCEQTKLSNGALMHHFPSRPELLEATIQSAYHHLTEYRHRQLAPLQVGLERFRAIIDLAWATSSMPEGIAVNEIRIGARCDSALAKALSPSLTFIADDYGRFVNRHAREAGLTDSDEMRGLWAATAMAVRSLAIDRVTYQNPQIARNALLALRTLREDIIGKQLGARMRVDPATPGIGAKSKLAVRRNAKLEA